MSFPRTRREPASPGITCAMFLPSDFWGVLIAFLIIGLYYGFGGLTQEIAKLFGGEGTLARRLVLIAVPLALAAVATVLTLGLWNMVWGRSAITSQALMRWRVALQFIAICLVMAALYLSVK